MKPVIPGVPGTVGKLPQGWRMVTGADGKPYYFNKKTGETSWEPPPPTPEGDKDFSDQMESAKDAAKDLMQRAKHFAAVKVFKASTDTADDTELNTSFDKVLQVELQVKAIKTQTEAYLASLVEMCWSAEQLATKFGDYMCEPGAVGQDAAAQAAVTWKELQKGAQRSLEVQFTAKVLQPLAAYLGEIGGIKQL